MSAPLVLLHGWGSSPAVWSALREALPRALEIHAPALPGHGGAFVASADVAAWADAIGSQLPPTSVLCGWSLGGLLALRIARRRPERVERLVLIGCTPCFVQRDDWPSALPEGDVAQFQQSFEADPDGLLKRFHALQVVGDAQRKPTLRGLALARAPAADADRPTMAAGLEILRRTDLRAELPAIEQPVRVLHGAGDSLMPVDAAVAMSDALADGRLSVFDDCGHAPHLSRARDCAALIEGFVDG